LKILSNQTSASLIVKKSVGDLTNSVSKASAEFLFGKPKRSIHFPAPDVLKAERFSVLLTATKT